MSICSIDILVSKDGREYVHDINDVIALFGESQEDDRRNAAVLLRAVLAPPPRLPSRPSTDRSREFRVEHHAIRTPSVDKKPTENSEPKEIKSQPSVTSQSSFADDTMGQLKRTFAGIFGDVG
uniref:Cell division protein ZapA n=1 Tax=Angiostrongylus cantonensis TaxID=6313 RepID=A0A0K0D2K3_ANGCA